MEIVSWGTDPDFFIKRLRDYDNWRIAFWREVVQNSRDACAKNVSISVEDSSFDGFGVSENRSSVRVVIEDDGIGMDTETLWNAFFRRGGSHKSVGSAGGFGDAKNLILTPWMGYEVHTRNNIVRGVNETIYKDLSHDSAPYYNGTKLVLHMPVDMCTTAEHAQFLIEQSSLDIKFLVNGKRVTGKLPSGNVVLEEHVFGYDDSTSLGNMVVRHSPYSKRKGIYVRSYGIFTYEVQGFDSGFKGVVTVDINAPPIGVFTTKRDGLSYDSTARTSLNNVLSSLTTSPGTILRKSKDKKEIIFRGAGHIRANNKNEVASIATEISNRLNSVTTTPESIGFVINEVVGNRNVTCHPLEVSSEMIENDNRWAEVEVAPSLPESFGDAMKVNIISKRDNLNIEEIALVAANRPDFFLYQNISPWTMPKGLHPDSMKRKYKELISFWTEVCRFIIIQLDITTPFGVGWVFDTEWNSKDVNSNVCIASCRKYQGVDWLLINPIKIRMTRDDRFVTIGDMYSLKNDNDVEQIVVSALHEVTHMQGYTNHNEAFSYALTDNSVALLRIQPVLDDILKYSIKFAKNNSWGI